MTSAVMQVLRWQGLDEPYIKVLDDVFKDSTASIRPNFTRIMSKFHNIS